MDKEPVITVHGPLLRTRITALPKASLLLTIVIALTFVDVFTGWRPAAFIATPFLIGYFALVWQRLILNGRVLLIGCAVIAFVAATQPAGMEILERVEISVNPGIPKSARF